MKQTESSNSKGRGIVTVRASNGFFFGPGLLLFFLNHFTSVFVALEQEFLKRGTQMKEDQGFLLGEGEFRHIGRDAVGPREMGGLLGFSQVLGEREREGESGWARASPPERKMYPFKGGIQHFLEESGIERKRTWSAPKKEDGGNKITITVHKNNLFLVFTRNPIHTHTTNK